MRKDFLIDIKGLVALRRELHRFPEISGCETATAERIASFISRYSPDSTIKGIGGTGIAAVFKGREPGSRIMFRCELDALPIAETNEFDYKSEYEKISHKCGHDGHMAIVAGLASLLAHKRPRRGSVILLFQSAEETGEGADRTINDGRFTEIEPDYVFGVHNLPGFDFNTILVRSGIFTYASKGMIIRLKGKESHAARPEDGINPALAIAKLIEELKHLPAVSMLLNEPGLVTIIFIRLGEIALGTSPGYGEIIATLRAYCSNDMRALTEEAENIVKRIAQEEKLSFEIAYAEEFPATINDAECIEIIETAALENRLRIKKIDKPFKWSEDFSHFTGHYKGGLFGLGAGINHPQLHNPDYDFPDRLIESGISIFYSIYNNILNRGHEVL